VALIYKNEAPDRDQYFSLFKSTGWNDTYQLTKEELASTLERSFFCVSVYDEQELIGFGRVMSDGILHAMIYEMIIRPEYQRKGIGKEVLSLLVTRCQQSNIRDIQLFCAKGKREFYEKYGFLARPEDGPGMELKNWRPQL
jgi:ribosomal protein S18 acetylase RimI-like enzyme